MKGVVISGTGSGVGKTSITTGLMSILSKQSKVQAYKIGPDFIDPMYHSVATGRRSRNLDSFLMNDDTIKNLVGHSSKDADLCVIEGVRGLFEGISGTTDECSTAEMAKILGFPVILVVNARSLTRSAAAIINGFKSFDDRVNIAGVIFNNVSGKQHETKLLEATEKYCDIEVIGVVKHDSDNSIGQRHLGLNTIGQYGKGDIEPLESMVSELDIDRVLDIAESSEICDVEYNSPYTEHDSGIKAAVPMDDSYCFYYYENIECMKAAGMDVRFFKPTAGDHLPDADFYYLGGGYPELHISELSDNRDFMEGLKNASDENRMILGECGGLMTMCRSIENKGVCGSMSSIFDYDAKMSGRHGPSYVMANVTEKNPIFSQMSVRGHEFHYSEIDAKSCVFGYDIRRGTGIDGKHDGIIRKKSLGSYIHQHALSVPDWLSKVVSDCQ